MPFIDAARHASVDCDKSLSNRNKAPAINAGAKPMLLSVLYCLANSTTCVCCAYKSAVLEVQPKRPCLVLVAHIEPIHGERDAHLFPLVPHIGVDRHRLVKALS